MREGTGRIRAGSGTGRAAGRRRATWRLLTAAEALSVVGVAALVEVGLRVVRLPLVARWCGVRLQLTAAPVASTAPLLLPPRTRRQLRAVDAVMQRWPFGDTCLRRSLVLGHRLRHFDPDLRIGVASDDQGFRAHSWLEISGHPLDSEFAEFAAFGDAQATDSGYLPPPGPRSGHSADRIAPDSSPELDATAP